MIRTVAVGWEIRAWKRDALMPSMTHTSTFVSGIDRLFEISEKDSCWVVDLAAKVANAMRRNLRRIAFVVNFSMPVRVSAILLETSIAHLGNQSTLHVQIAILCLWPPLRAHPHPGRSQPDPPSRPSAPP